MKKQEYGGHLLDVLVALLDEAHGGLEEEAGPLHAFLGISNIMQDLGIPVGPG